MPKAAVIIHTCTKYCDYPSLLTVVPEGIPDDAERSMRKKIFEATRTIDTLEKDAVRAVIFTVDSYVMAGLVAFLRHLSGSSPEDERFYTDERGRSIYAFTGAVFRQRQQVPRLDKKVLWKCFRKYMDPVWEAASLAVQTSSFEEFPVLHDTGKSDRMQTFDGSNFYEISGDDTRLFHYWLRKASKGQQVSFCSNIIDYRIIKERIFTTVTTTANNLKRAEQEFGSL